MTTKILFPAETEALINELADKIRLFGNTLLEIERTLHGAKPENLEMLSVVNSMLHAYAENILECITFVREEP